MPGFFSISLNETARKLHVEAFPLMKKDNKCSLREHLKIGIQWYIYKWYGTATQMLAVQGLFRYPTLSGCRSRDAKQKNSTDQNKICTK